MRSFISAALIAAATFAFATAFPVRADVTPHSSEIKTDGAYPSNSLTLGSDGKFYGVALRGGEYNYGTVFRFDPHGNGDTVVLHSFSGKNGDGELPSGALTEDAEGNFYGTTFYGGTSNKGTIYTLTADGRYVPLYSFDARSSKGQYPVGALLEYGDHLFAGVTDSGLANDAGSIYTFSVDSAATTPSLAGGPHFRGFGDPSGVNSKGADPRSGPILGPDGLICGTTFYGGLDDLGTVYGFDPVNDVLHVLHDFSGGDDGATPEGPLLYADDTLYGTTVSGGLESGAGTIFSIGSDGAHSTLLRFHGTNGLLPSGALALGENGDLWLTLPAGGKHDQGVIMDFVGGGADNRCNSFRGQNDPSGLDGWMPSAGLTLGNDGLFYGMTVYGGKYSKVTHGVGYGTIFSVDPATMQHTILHSFGRPLTSTGH